MEDSTPAPSDTQQVQPNGHVRPTMLSSTSTLFWRLFVPVAGTVFILCFVVMFWLIDPDDYYAATNIWVMRLVWSLIFLGWLYLMYRTLWRLKRVDMDPAFLYVTDYWNTVRYPVGDIEKMETVKRWGRTIGKIYLKAPGRFGRVINYLPAKTKN